MKRQIFPTASKYRRRTRREFGGETVEYIIVILAVVVIGGGLMGFGNQVSGQIGITGNSISSWFGKANGAGDNASGGNGSGGGNNAGGENKGDENSGSQLQAPTVSVTGMDVVGERVTAKVSNLPEGATRVSYQWQYSPTRKTDRPWYRADCTLGEESSIKPGGKFKILLSERQYARADAQKKAGKPVSLGLKTARYPDGVEIDGEMVALEDLAADINVRKTNPLPKSPEEYRGATEQSFDRNEWVNFRFFPDLVDLSKSIDPDTARTDYRADVTSEIAGRNCSFTLHLAKWQYDKAVKAQSQNYPIHIGMKLKYIKGGVIPVQFEGEQFTHNYSPKKLEESLPKVQKARSVSGCRQGKGNRVSSYQDRSYRFKTEEACERGLPGAHESRN